MEDKDDFQSDDAPNEFEEYLEMEREMRGE